MIRKKFDEGKFQAALTEKVWEKAMGADPQQRTERLGRDSQHYRDLVHLPPSDNFRKTHHENFIHTLGADVLKSIFSDEYEERERQKKFMVKKEVAAVSVIRKRIKVDDFDDGGLSVAIEQDWDTSGWNETLIHAGMEALICIFYNLHGEATIPRKERAIMMIQKLLDRHHEADSYLRKNAESLMAQSVSKYIRDGKAASVLDILYILNQGKDRLVVEMSNFSYAGKVIEMMMQECRLAAVLIQHTFRAKKAKERLRNTIWSHTYFGTEREVYYRQVGVINARSMELRSVWRSFRSHYPREVTQSVGGLRGPLHMGHIYVELALDIIRHLVSDSAMLLAHSNREDIVRADGTILLSTLLGTAHSPFGAHAAVILAEISKVVEAFLPLLRTGVMFSAVQYLQYLRRVFRVGHAVLKEKKARKIQLIRSFLATMDILSNTALHAAGLYRARHRYDFQRKDSSGLEVTDYQKVLAEFRHIPFTDYEKYLRPLLVPRVLLQELSTQIQTASQPSVLNAALRCLYFYASSECQDMVTKEVTAQYGKLMIQLISLLHHPCDHATRTTTGNIVIALFLQLTSTPETRKALATVSIQQHIVPLNQKYQQPQANIAIDSIMHYRGMLLAAALNRQDTWRCEDPERLLDEIEAQPSLWLREHLLLDLLRTIKDENYDGFNRALTIADLVIMPTDAHRALQVAKSVGNLCALEIVHTLYHPHDIYYYESCPLHEAVAVIQILESFASYAHTGQVIFADTLVYFLAKFLYLCKYLFLGKPMNIPQVMVLLHGVKAAFLTLGRLALAVKDQRVNAEIFCQGVQSSDLVSTSLFFLNTLSTFHEKTDPEIVRLQKIVGISSLAFFSKFATLLNVYEAQHHRLQQKHTIGSHVDFQRENNNNIKTNTALLSSPTTSAQKKKLMRANSRRINGNKSRRKRGSSKYTDGLYHSSDEDSEDCSDDESDEGEEGKLGRLSICIEDLFPSGKIATELFHNLKTIIQQRHKQQQEQDLLNALSQPAKHQQLPSTTTNNQLTVPGSPTKSSFLVSTPATIDAGKDGGTPDSKMSFNSNSPLHSKKPHQRDLFHHTTSTHKAHTLDPREEFLQVLDAMCQFLMALTATGQAGAYAAVQEWRIFDTLQRYLPPPLSGLNDVKDSHLRSSIFAQTRASVVTSSGPELGSPTRSGSVSSPSRRFSAYGPTAGSLMAADDASGHQQAQRRGSVAPQAAALQATLRFFGASAPRPAPGMGLIALEDHQDSRANPLNNANIYNPNRQQQLQQTLGRMAQTGLQMLQTPAGHHNHHTHHGTVQPQQTGAYSHNYKVNNDPHQLDLTDLPASYFSLCANLCRLQEGASLCLTGGFLRRACDKCMHLYAQLLHYRNPVTGALNTSQRNSLEFPWEYRKLDFIACLRVIAACANFHSPAQGSANDLIFSAAYDIVLVCKSLITLRLKRTEEVVLVAYETLAALARDTFRVNHILEVHDVYEDIRQELLVLTHHFPLRGVLCAVQTIHYSTLGLTSPYLARMIPLLREPLTKVVRLYPQLDEAVRNANWTLTKSAMIYRTTVDPTYGGGESFDGKLSKDLSGGHNKDQDADDALALEIEHFIRTGSMEPIQKIIADLETQHEEQEQTPQQQAAYRLLHGTDSPLPAGASPVIPGKPQQALFPPSPTTKTSAETSIPSFSMQRSQTPPNLRSIPVQQQQQQQQQSGNGNTIQQQPQQQHSGHPLQQKKLSHEASPRTSSATARVPSREGKSRSSSYVLNVDTPGQYSHMGVTRSGSLHPLLYPSTATAPPPKNNTFPEPRNLLSTAGTVINAKGQTAELTPSKKKVMIVEHDLVKNRVNGDFNEHTEGADLRYPLSQLSARDQGERSLVQIYKGKAGFTDIEKTTLYPREPVLPVKKVYSSTEYAVGPSSTAAAVSVVSTSMLPDLLRTRPPPPGRGKGKGL